MSFYGLKITIFQLWQNTKITEHIKCVFYAGSNYGFFFVLWICLKAYWMLKAIGKVILLRHRHRNRRKHWNCRKCSTFFFCVHTVTKKMFFQQTRSTDMPLFIPFAHKDCKIDRSSRLYNIDNFVSMENGGMENHFTIFTFILRGSWLWHLEQRNFLYECMSVYMYWYICIIKNDRHSEPFFIIDKKQKKKKKRKYVMSCVSTETILFEQHNHPI